MLNEQNHEFNISLLYKNAEGSKKQCNQETHQTQDNATWESDKNIIEHHKREPKDRPFSQQVTTRQQYTDATA